MSDLVIAIIIAVLLSVLIAFIEIAFRSKTSQPWKRLSGAFVVFLLILGVGNVATTIFAASSISAFIEGRTEPIPTESDRAHSNIEARKTSTALPATTTQTDMEPSSLGKPGQRQGLAYPWFWYAFVGVFGFEALLQNMNVTLFGHGVLSISDWIGRARDIAVGDAIKGEADASNMRAESLANHLRTMPEATLRTYVINHLGQKRLAELLRQCTANGADLLLAMSLALAYESPDRAAAIP